MPADAAACCGAAGAVPTPRTWWRTRRTPLMSELRRSAARLEETLYLLNAVHQVASLKEEEFQAVDSGTSRGGVRMRVRRLERDRLEVTLIPRSAESLPWQQEATEAGVLLAGEQAGRGITLYVDLDREEPR